MNESPNTAALSALERAFAEAPDSPAAPRLAEAYLEQGRVLEALVIAARRVRLHPEDPAARVLLARVHVARGRQAEAQRELDAAARLSPRVAAGLSPPGREDPPLPDPPPLDGRGEEVAPAAPRVRGDEASRTPPSTSADEAASAATGDAVPPPSPPRGEGRGGVILEPASGGPRPGPRSPEVEPEPGPRRRQLLGTLALALIAAALVALTLAQAISKAHRADDRDAVPREAVHGRPAAASPAR